VRNPDQVSRETQREQRFSNVWENELNDVFADVAPYYDRANVVASLGLWSWFLDQFMSLMTLRPGQQVLDVCAGTNAVGIALLTREPGLKVQAMDRSEAMQTVGRQRAQALGLTIESTIGDVHELPFPDNHFDIVTLQWASRHLRMSRVLSEVRRVLKPGGHFYHCDMLRPASPLVAQLYYAYLRFSLNFTSVVFRSGKPALNCRKYFIDALGMFYSADELSDLMRQAGLVDVTHKKLLMGMIGVHRAART
jgi:demethylmenaquinone methyltransferase / 2-methoxy-6-polyprenyl-1,4-benzoquinol methylase